MLIILLKFYANSFFLIKFCFLLQVRVNGAVGRRSNPGFVGKSPNNPNVEVQVYGL
jgi:hypothetical protein